MREYTLLLENALNTFYDSCNNGDGNAIDKLFNFDYGLPDEYRKLFEYKFFMRYRFYNINFDSFAMFKSQLESKLLELTPKYVKLYKSENIICNPFINYSMESDSFNRSRGQNKNYLVNNNRGHASGENIGGGINVSRTGNVAGMSASEFSTSNSNDKNKSSTDNKDYKVNKFTDSPQSKITDEKLFNNGYITTKTRDDSRSASINSTENEGWNQVAGQSGNSSFNNTENYSDNINESKNTSKTESYSDSYALSANQNTMKAITQNYGLSGVTVSNIVNEWRSTFINIDKMFLDELKELFILVY